MNNRWDDLQLSSLRKSRESPLFRNQKRASTYSLEEEESFFGYHKRKRFKPLLIWFEALFPRKSLYCSVIDRKALKSAVGPIFRSYVTSDDVTTPHGSSRGLLGRVRGRVLMAQEHQPLPSEQCWPLSRHTALQEPLRSCLAWDIRHCGEFEVIIFSPMDLPMTDFTHRNLLAVNRP